MPAKSNDDTTEAEIRAMAKRLGLKGEELRKYVHRHMTGLGYDAVTSYRKGGSSSRRSKSGGVFGFDGDDDDDDDDDL